MSHLKEEPEKTLHHSAKAYIRNMFGRANRPEHVARVIKRNYPDIHPDHIDRWVQQAKDRQVIEAQMNKDDVIEEIRPSAADTSDAKKAKGKEGRSPMSRVRHLARMALGKEVEKLQKYKEGSGGENPLWKYNEGYAKETHEGRDWDTEQERLAKMINQNYKHKPEPAKDNHYDGKLKKNNTTMAAAHKSAVHTSFNKVKQSGAWNEEVESKTVSEGAVENNPVKNPTITLKHKTSGKEIVVAATATGEYKKIGYLPKDVKEEVYPVCETEDDAHELADRSIALHKKLGHRIEDEKRGRKNGMRTASFVVTDLDGVQRRHSFEGGRRSIENLGSIALKKDDSIEPANQVKRKRGRPRKKFQESLDEYKSALIKTAKKCKKDDEAITRNADGSVAGIAHKKYYA